MATKKRSAPTKKISTHIQRNLLLAQDPLTSAAVLEKLSLSTNDAVRRAVTANPNSPGRVLLRLSKFCFNAFAHNPALPVLMLADPGFLNGIPEHAAMRLVDLTDLPEGLMLALAASANEKVRARIATHPNLPRQCFEALLFDDDFVVRERARRNINLPEELSSVLVAFDVGEDGRLTEACTELSEEVLRHTASKGFWGKTLVARHPKAPPDLLESIYEQTESDGANQARMHTYLLENPNLPLHILERALHSRKTDLVRLAAMNRSTPTEMIEPIIDRLDEPVYLLERPDLSSEGLSVLLERLKTVHYAPGSLWNHPSLTAMHLARLATMEGAHFRREAALHQKTPEHVLQALTQDKDQETSHNAKETLKTQQ